MNHFSIVPDHYKENDPRSLMYLFPSMPKVKFAKLMSKFTFYKQLEVGEEMASRQGFIFVPFGCMHWQRRKDFSERKLKIGRNSFFTMKLTELTDTEKKKLNLYIDENVKDKKLVM